MQVHLLQPQRFTVIPVNRSLVITNAVSSRISYGALWPPKRIGESRNILLRIEEDVFRPYDGFMTDIISQVRPMDLATMGLVSRRYEREAKEGRMVYFDDGTFCLCHRAVSENTVRSLLRMWRSSTSVSSLFIATAKTIEFFKRVGQKQLELEPHHRTTITEHLGIKEEIAVAAT